MPEGISWSPAAPSDAEANVALLPPSAPSPNFVYQLPLGSATKESLMRLEPPHNVTIGHNYMSQRKLRTSTPAKLLDVAISDDEQNWRKITEEEHHAMSHTAVEECESLDVNYRFSPLTSSQRPSLFGGLPNSSENEER